MCVEKKYKEEKQGWSVIVLNANLKFSTKCSAASCHRENVLISIYKYLELLEVKLIRVIRKTKGQIYYFSKQINCYRIFIFQIVEKPYYYT